jgi:hypothetical protein
MTSGEAGNDNKRQDEKLVFISLPFSPQPVLREANRNTKKLNGFVHGQFLTH